MSALPTDWTSAIAHYQEHGYARLGVLASEDRLSAMRARIDDLMMARLPNQDLFFQIDAPSGSYDDLTYGKGFEGPTLNYRKVERLERDPVFREWIEHPLLAPICRHVYGPEISLYRAVVFNKSAELGGSSLPWHQDGGTFWGLSQEPVLQIWTALDDVPREAGCLEVYPGSHRAGLATPLGGVVPDNHVLAQAPETKSVFLPAQAGEVILIHNHMWHRSARNLSGKPRRALTVCYMDAKTRCLRKRRAPRQFVRLFTEAP